MDLLVPIISGLSILGYNFAQSTTNEPRYESNIRDNIPPNSKNSALNTYTSTYSKEVSNAERELSKAKHLQAQDPASTNVIPAFFNDHCSTSNSCDTTMTRSAPNTILPKISNVSNGQQFPDTQGMMKAKVDSIMNSPMFNMGNFNLQPMESTSSGFTPIVKEAFTPIGSQQVSDLTGCTFENTHNNMVPFFGSNVKQNTDLNKTQSTLDRYTGNDRHLQKHKVEISPMFAPVQQNIYGTQSDQQRDRYYQSQLKTNLLPLPQIKEAPLPADSFRGRYKDVNQLRVKQKITNKTADPIDGLKVAMTSQPLAYQKNKPETSFQTGAERSFVQGPIAQSNPLNYENRRSAQTENPGYLPSGFSGQGLAKSGAREVKISEALQDINNMLVSYSTDDKRNTDKTTGFRNANSGSSVYNEVAREGFKDLNETQRDTTSTYRVNIASDQKVGKYHKNNQRARTTNKETTLFSYTGDATSSVQGQTGEHGKSTRKTDKVGAKNYIGVGNGSYKQVRETSSYETADIKSNRENVSNTKNYAISLTDKINEQGGITMEGNGLKGVSVPIGADDYNVGRYKSGIVEKNAREYGTYGNIVADTGRQYGITTVSNVRLIPENDNTDRISTDFVDQLLNNDFNIDFRDKAKKSKVIRKPIQV
jgi:hypothetical protein